VEEKNRDPIVVSRRHLVQVGAPAHGTRGGYGSYKGLRIAARWGTSSSPVVDHQEDSAHRTSCLWALDREGTNRVWNRDAIPVAYLDRS
jgi:hypothetical protein